MSANVSEGGILKERSFCFECIENRNVYNNRCCKCKSLIDPTQPEKEGANDRGQSNECHYTFSDSNSSSLHNAKEIRSNYSPIPPRKHSQNRKRRLDHQFNTNNNLRNRKKMKKSAVIDLTHDSNSDIDSNSEDDLQMTKGNSPNNNKFYPDFVPNTSPSLSVSVHNTRHYKTRHAPPSQPPSNHNHNAGANSPSLSITRHINDMTFDFRKAVMNKWRRIGLKHKTLQGLESLTDLGIPSKVGIAMIHAIKNQKHVIASMVNYEERLLYLVVALLEIMKLNGNGLNRRTQPQVIVVSSRRHSAEACARLVREVGKVYNVKSEAIIGGKGIGKCIQILRKGLQVLPCTPGILNTMIRKKQITKEYLNNLMCVVFDDADELWSSESNRRQMVEITYVLPDRNIKCLWLESVMNSYGLQIAKRQIRRHDCEIQNMSDERAMISVVKESNGMQCRNGLDDHIIVNIGGDFDRRNALMEILENYRVDRHIIIFFNVKKEMREFFEEYLSRDDRDLPRRRRFIFVLDGNERRNEEREHVIVNFKEDGGILFCSDLFSKGISLPIDIVINFDIPRDVRTYISRVGCVRDKNKKIAVFNLYMKSNKCSRRRTDDEMILDELRQRSGVHFQEYYEYASARLNDVNERYKKIF